MRREDNYLVIEIVNLPVLAIFDSRVICLGSTGAAGPRLFTIHLVEINTDNLPKAHTWYGVYLSFVFYFKMTNDQLY